MAHPLIGRRAVLWTRHNGRGGWRRDAVAVVEVFAPGDAVPQTMRHDIPRPHDLVLRYLLADGLRGKRVERLRHEDLPLGSYLRMWRWEDDGPPSPE